MLTQVNREKFKLVFDKLDSDKNGVLSKEEFINGQKLFFGETFTNEEASGLFHKIDDNGDGWIQFDEFVLHTMDEKDLCNRDNLLAAFNAFDTDGSKTIDLKELMDIYEKSPDFDKGVAQ